MKVVHGDWVLEGRHWINVKSGKRMLAIMGGTNPPAFDQDTFRGRDDDVGLNVDTWNGGGGLGGDWTQDADVNFRIRFLVQETAGNKLNNATFTLFFNHEGAGYVEMTAATALRPAPTTEYAQADTTTQLIGSGTYIGGDSEGGVDDAEDTGLIDVEANNEFEVEFCLTIDSAQVSDEDTILVRVYESDGTVFGSYTDTPTITVNVPQIVHELAGTSQGQASTSGTLEVVGITHELAGASQGQASTVGRMAVTWALMGVSNGVATALADTIIVTGVTEVLLEGASQGQASTLAKMAINRGLRGTSVGIASTEATILPVRGLVGVSQGQATAIGRVAVTWFLQGASAGIASTFGSLATAGTVDLAGVSQGQASTVATLSMDLPLVGVSQGQATVTADLLKLVLMGGVSDGQASTLASMGLIFELEGTASGQASAFAEATMTYGLFGSADGVATTVADLTGGTIISFAGAVALDGSFIVDVSLEAEFVGDEGQAHDSGANLLHGIYSDVNQGGPTARAYYDTPDFPAMDIPLSWTDLGKLHDHIDFDEVLAVLRIKAVSGFWGLPVGNSRRIFFLGRSDTVNSITNVNYVSFSDSLLLEYWRYTFRLDPFFYEAETIETAISTYDWTSIGILGSLSQGELALYEGGIKKATSASVPAAVEVVTSDAPSFLGGNVLEGFRGWMGDFVVALAGADISSPDTKVSDINTKLDAGTLTGSDLDTHFGADKWAWYKQNEDYHGVALGGQFAEALTLEGSIK